MALISIARMKRFGTKSSSFYNNIITQMARYTRSMSQAILNINQFSTNIGRGLYHIKRLDVLTTLFTDRFEELKKDLYYANICEDNELYQDIMRQIIKIQNQIYGVVKEKSIVARQLQEMITTNEPEVMAALESELKKAKKPQRIRRHRT